VILRGAVGITNVERLVGVRALQVYGHAERHFGIGDVLYLAGDFLAALHKLLVELRHQRFGAFGVHLFERSLGVVSHAIRHDGDGGKNGEQDDQQ